VTQLRKQMLEEIQRRNYSHRTARTYVRERRKEINRKYDYRYSQLRHVFGRLLHEGRLREEELRGLREDKLKPIRSLAKFLAEDAA
jgi:hypothetical protein